VLEMANFDPFCTVTQVLEHMCRCTGVKTPVANADLVAGRSSCNAYLAVKWKLQSSGRASTVAGIGIIGKADLDRHLIGISSVWEGLTHEQMD
jgi:hypothetical protein